MKELKKVEKLLLSYSNIKKVVNKKQLSYYDEYGVVVMLKYKDSKLVASFGRGAKLMSKFPKLKGDGKIVRYLEYIEIDRKELTLLKNIVDESLILGLESYELKRLTK